MAVLGKQNNLASREKNSIVLAILAIHPGISWVKVGTMILKSFQLQLWVLDSRLRQTAPVHLQEKCHIELKTFPETVYVSWERSSDTKALQTASLFVSTGVVNLVLFRNPQDCGGMPVGVSVTALLQQTKGEDTPYK